MKERVEIPLSKNKLILGFIYSLLFVIAGVWLFLNSELYAAHFPIEFVRNPLFIQGVGVSGILLFGLTGVLVLRKFFDNSNGLVIDNTGITDNSSSVSVGLIEWEDITGILTKRVVTTKFLIVQVNNPEKYLSRAENKAKAKLMRANMKICGSPIQISSGTLKYNFKKLEELVQTEFEKNKKI